MIDVNGEVGVRLQTSGGTDVLSVYFDGPDANYAIADNGGEQDSGVFFTQEGVTIKFELTSATTHKTTITRLVDGASNFKTGNISGTISRVEIYADGPGIEADYKKAFFNSLSHTVQPLPVELVNFDGRKTDRHIELFWQTASETNNSHFHIQRSSDIRKWETIGKVYGKGTTLELQDYFFIDESPQKGINYYRLKQEDFDGKFEFSKIVSVSFEKEKTLNIIPNPNPGIFTLQFENELMSPISVSVFNAQGGKIDYQKLEQMDGNIYFDLSTQKSGIYS